MDINIEDRLMFLLEDAHNMNDNIKHISKAFFENVVTGVPKLNKPMQHIVIKNKYVTFNVSFCAFIIFPNSFLLSLLGFLQPLHHHPESYGLQ